MKLQPNIALCSKKGIAFDLGLFHGLDMTLFSLSILDSRTDGVLFIFELQIWKFIVSLAWIKDQEL